MNDPTTRHIDARDDDVRSQEVGCWIDDLPVGTKFSVRVTDQEQADRMESELKDRYRFLAEGRGYRTFVTWTVREEFYYIRPADDGASGTRRISDGVDMDGVVMGRGAERSLL